MTTSDPLLALVFPLALGVRLPWFDSEGLASVTASDPDSVISPTAETCWPPSRGVSSSGAVGIVTVIRVRSVGEVTKKRKREREGRKRKKRGSSWRHVGSLKFKIDYPDAAWRITRPLLEYNIDSLITPKDAARNAVCCFPMHGVKSSLALRSGLV